MLLTQSHDGKGELDYIIIMSIKNVSLERVQTIHVTYVLNDSFREVLKLFILTKKVDARMKFCEVINDFANI